MRIHLKTPHQRRKQGLSASGSRVPGSFSETHFRLSSPDLPIQRQTISSGQFERVFDCVGDGLLILNTRGRILHANQRACTMLQVKRHTILGHPFSRYLDSRTGINYEQGLRQITSGARREITIDASLRTAQQALHARATLSALDNVQTRIIVDLHDIGELKELLADKHHQEMITALAGATAHKLNQPLTAVIGYVQMLQRITKDTRDREIVEKIELAAQEISELVREIGRITKFETNRYGNLNNILRIQSDTKTES